MGGRQKTPSAEAMEKQSIREFLREFLRPETPVPCPHPPSPCVSVVMASWRRVGVGGRGRAGRSCLGFSLPALPHPGAFPLSLPPAFPCAASRAFLAHSCVWTPISQAVIDSKQNLFFLNYFQDVMQTCLNYGAAISTLRSALDFVVIQAAEGKKAAETQSAGTPPSILQ